MDRPDPSGGAPRTPDGPPLASPPAPTWGLGRFAVTAIASFVAAASASLLVVLALGIADKPAQERTPLDLLLVTLATDAALIAVLAVVGRRLLRLVPRDLGFRRPSPAQIRFALSAGVGLWVLSILVNALTVRFLGPRPQSLVVSFGAHEGPEALVLDLITGAVLAPVAEETLYRGLIFAGLAQRLPFAVAAGISALLFGVVHGVGVLLPIFVLGFGLAWVYRRTGTLWAPITAHALVNAISLAILFAAPRPM